MFAAYVLGVLFSLIFLGSLADRLGRKPAILIFVALAALSATPHRQARVISLYYIFGYLMTAVFPLLSSFNGVIPVLYLTVVVAVLSLFAARFVIR